MPRGVPAELKILEVRVSNMLHPVPDNFTIMAVINPLERKL